MKTMIGISKGMAVMTMIILLTACTSDNYDMEMTPKAKTPDVISKIENINAELEQLKTPFVTRGWKDWNRNKRNELVRADFTGCYDGVKYGYNIGKQIDSSRGGCFGAIIGGVIGGGVSSWWKYRDLDHKLECNDADIETISELCRSLAQKGDITESGITNLDEALKGDSIVNNDLILLSNLDALSLCIGKMHNTALATFDGSSGPNMDIKDEKYPDKKIDAETIELQLRLIDSKELKTKCKQIAIDICTGEKNESDSTTDKIIRLFDEALDSYTENAEDIAFIIGKYCEIIDSTADLTDEEKTQVKAAFSTALYSISYWETKMK